MALTVQKLAIPRKQNTVMETASYTRGYTPEIYHVISGNMTIHTPLDPQTPIIKYFPRVYIGATYLKAFVYTNQSSTQDVRIADLTKGVLLYQAVPNGETVDGIDVMRIRCDKPDGTSFMLNPGYYLGSGLYCVGISFLDYQYVDCDRNVTTVVETAGIAPRNRETRTDDNINFEVAITPATFRFSVEIEIYNASTHDYEPRRIVNDLENDSYMGRGGLYSFYTCAGVDYKAESAAEQNPSGQWYTENKTIKTDIGVQVSWT